MRYQFDRRLVARVILPAIALGAIWVAVFLLGKDDPHAALHGDPDVSDQKAESLASAGGQAIETKKFIGDERAVVFSVIDSVSSKPLGGVEVFLDSSKTTMIGKSKWDGDLVTTERLAAKLSDQCFVRLPEAIGGREAPAIVAHGGEAMQVVAMAYSRIIATIYSTDDTSDAGPILEKGKLWCVSWPTPAEAAGAAIGQRREAANSAYESCFIHSDTLSTSIGISYHTLLREFEGCQPSKLTQIGTDSAVGEDVVFDIPFSGDVILDYYSPTIGVTRQRVTASIGSVVRTRIRVDRPVVVKVRIIDQHGNGISGARVDFSLRREIQPGECVPAQAHAIVTPEGSSLKEVFAMKSTASDQDGYAHMLATFKGVVFAGIVAPGFLAKGEIVWTSKESFPDKCMAVRMETAPKGVPRTLITFKGVPLPNTDNITIVDLDPVAQFFQVQFNAWTSDGDGKIDLSQLVHGHKYAAVVVVDGARLNKEFVYSPGVSIDM